MEALKLQVEESNFDGRTTARARRLRAVSRVTRAIDVLRNEKKYSYEEIGELVGKSKDSIASYRYGRARPPVSVEKQLIKLSRKKRVMVL